MAHCMRGQLRAAVNGFVRLLDLDLVVGSGTDNGAVTV